MVHGKSRIDPDEGPWFSKGEKETRERSSGRIRSDGKSRLRVIHTCVPRCGGDSLPPTPASLSSLGALQIMSSTNSNFLPSVSFSISKKFFPNSIKGTSSEEDLAPEKLGFINRSSKRGAMTQKLIHLHKLSKAFEKVKQFPAVTTLAPVSKKNGKENELFCNFIDAIYWI